MPCTAFSDKKRIAAGELPDVALRCKEVLERNPQAQVLIFDDATSELIEVDFRGAPPRISEPIPEVPPRGPGRPRLGVVAREVTLLPRHWEWLAAQPGGASVALRKLVEHAIKANRNRDRVRRAQEVTYRFMSAMAGNEAGYEEALRALFGGRQELFDALVAPWPADVRAHARELAASAFATEER